MMETSAIGSPTAGFTTPQPTTRSLSDLDSEDFFGLLIAELQSQDPLNPTDNQQLLAQMSSIRQMQQSTTLNKTLLALAAEQRFGGTTGLIGHYVSGSMTNEAGATTEVQGLVVGVRFQPDGKAILELHNGLSLPADKVDQVTLLENLPPDILEQIQAELDQAAGAGDSEEADVPAAARTLAKDAALNRAGAGSVLRGVGATVDTAASVLDALLSPGISVGL